MRGYNIYYKNVKINSRLLNKADVDDILNKTYILRHNNNTTDKILTSKLRVVPCVIV